MQLPRGTFRELKKGIPIESLLQGLREEFFSGYCRIANREVSASLVLEHGVVVLAESGESRGDAALADISRLGAAGVDAVLHSLNTTELQLSREFNPSAKVKNILEPTSHNRPVSDTTASTSPEPVEMVEGNGPSSPHTATSDVTGSTMMMDGTRPQEHVQRTSGSSLLLQDLESLDLMEIEIIAEKFKENCRQIIEKLDLEYLLESSHPKEGS
jgi:hypothetical protein